MHANGLKKEAKQVRHRSVVSTGNSAGAIRPRLQKLGYIKFLTLSDLDQRTRAAQRCKEHTAGLESDLGGVEHLTAAQRQLVQRAALLAVILEDFELRHWLASRSSLATTLLQ